MFHLQGTLPRAAFRTAEYCLLAASVASAQTGTGRPAFGVQPAGSSIEGRVVLTGSSQPLAGVDIFPVGSAPVPPIKTDQNGRFAFRRLMPGRYGLLLHPMSGYRSRDTTIVLRENQDVNGIEIVAYPGASIGGRVRDAKGRPVAGLGVSAIRLHGGGGRFPPDRVMAAGTNDLGEYRLSGLNPGRYALLVETRRSSISRQERADEDETKVPPSMPAEVRTYYPNATSLDLAAPVQVQEGQALEGMDITLGRVETFCVRSRLVDPDRQGTIRIRIQIASELYLGAANLAEGELAPGDGFEVCGLPPGAYSLLGSPLERGQNARYVSQSFTIANRSLQLPDLSLHRLIPLSGRLAIDSSSPRALPGPVSIELRGLGLGRPLVLDEQSRIRLTAPGSFVIPAVLPADYWLMVRTPAGFYVKSATAGGRDALREPLHASADELHIVLGQDAAEVSVLAVDPKNAPLGSASVIVGLDPLPPTHAPGDLVSVLTDQNGEAMLQTLAPGRYRVLVLADSAVDPANAQTLFLANRIKGEELTLGPNEKRSISVRALDRKD